MKASTVNVITRWVILGYLPVLFLWEMAVLALRADDPGVRTISQEARSIASRGMASLAYFWAGMAAHWFVTWHRLPLTGRLAVVAAVLWWAGLAAYLLSDIIVPEARVWIRHPAVAALVGAIGAWLLFGQESVWVP